MMHPGALAFGAVLIGGLASALNPCCLAMSPAMLAAVSNNFSSKTRSMLSVALAILGFAGTMAAIGAMTATLGLVFGHAGWFSYVVAAAPIVMALDLIGVFDLHFPAIRSAGLDGHFGALAVGGAYALVSAPCATPILASVLAVAASKGSALYGTLLLFVYGVGFGTPLCCLGAALGSLPKRTAWLSPAILNGITAVALMLTGFYLLWRA